MGESQGIIIGIDLGEKRVGVSISDEMGLYAHPLGVLPFVGDERLTEELVGIAKERGATAFVVGLPKNMDGTMGESAKKSERFAKKLERKSGLPVVMLDERLTTSQAEKEMIGLGKSRRRRRMTIDAVAAVLILETYLKQAAGMSTKHEGQ